MDRPKKQKNNIANYSTIGSIIKRRQSCVRVSPPVRFTGLFCLFCFKCYFYYLWTSPCYVMWWPNKIPHTVFFPIQFMNDVTLAYTPGYFACAHPIPQLTMPAWIQGDPGDDWTRSGPPLSPCTKKNRLVDWLTTNGSITLLSLRCKSLCQDKQRKACDRRFHPERRFRNCFCICRW
jgi:hypothetical protein